jgi:hypothetical protein
MIKVVCCISDFNIAGYRNGLALSCNLLKINLITLYHEDKWDSHRLKDNYLKSFLRSQPREQIVLFTDGYDTMFLAKEMAIYQKYLQLSPTREIVIAAETNCYPDNELKEEYPQIRGSYRFLNSGGIIGPAGKLLEALYEIDKMKLAKEDQGRYEWSNQYLWTKLFLSKSRPLILDYHCELFQTLSNDMESTHEFVAALRENNTQSLNQIIENEIIKIDNKFEFSYNLIRNRETMTQPLHLHFNGPIMKQIMFKEPFRALTRI